jgi:hypothetical protein
VECYCGLCYYYAVEYCALRRFLFERRRDYEKDFDS